MNPRHALLFAMLPALCQVSADATEKPKRDPNEPMKRNGLTWLEWCAEADIDPKQFSTHNLPGRWSAMWWENKNPKNIRTMKDRRGHNILVGDTVRFHGAYGWDKDDVGKVEDIKMNVYNGWDKRTEHVAVIRREVADPSISLCSRYSRSIERVDVW